MKLDLVANSKNDEFYTPLYAIKPIFKYVKPQSRIWCPFDSKKSLYVKYANLLGHTVYNSHIDEGVDFFNVSFEGKVDYIISNPPYSLRTQVLKRLFDCNVPFAMLVGVVGIFESQERFNMFKHNEFEIMYFNKRIAFFRDYDDEKPALNPPFSTVYICRGVLPKQIVFEEINKDELK